MEEDIKFRIAKPSDAEQIADLHWHVRDRYSTGIFLSLGKNFLKTYWKILLDDPWQVIICAENKNGKLVGFDSISMNPKEGLDRIKAHKFKLGISAIWSIIKKPKLIKEIWIRYKSISDKSSKSQFIHTEGARNDYWCWSKDDDSLRSMDLAKITCKVVKLFGIDEIFYEIDKTNKTVYNYQLKVIKAQPLEEIKLPDGRERVLFKVNT